MKQERGRRTREAILEAAMGLFSQAGFAATPIDEIARRAGIAPASIYNHFDGKAEILAALLERETDRVTAELSYQSLAGRDPRFWLREVGLATVRAHLKNLQFLRMGLGEAMRSPQVAQLLWDRYLIRGARELESRLEEAMAGGHLRSVESVSLVRLYLGALIFAVMALEILGGKGTEEVDYEAVVEGFVDLIWHGIRPGGETAAGNVQPAG